MELAPMIMKFNLADPRPIFMTKKKGSNSLWIIPFDLHQFACPTKDRLVGQRIKSLDVKAVNQVGNGPIRALHEIINALLLALCKTQHSSDHL